jgi:predicted permease
MDRLLQDVRHTLRGLARRPTFAAAALVTIALGVGANTAIFSVVDGILLRPLPYPRPDALVRLYLSSPEHDVLHGELSALDLADWGERARAFEGIAGYLSGREILAEAGDPVELQTTYVTSDFFPVLAMPVRAGRPLVDEDHRQATRNAVISERLWRSRFASDPAVLGRTLRLDGHPVSIVGVAPQAFRYPSPEIDVWMPHSLLTEDHVGPDVRDNRYLEVVARLAPGVSLERARSDLDAVASRIAAEYPASNAQWSAATVVPLKTAMVGRVDRVLGLVFAMVGIVFLIGCANLANLMLAQGTARARELAIRMALGADRLRLLRQLLTESLVLALLGGLLGLALSSWATEVFLTLSADLLPRVEDVGTDGRVLAFGIGLTLLTGLLFGLLPALRAARTDPQTHLRGGRGEVGTGGRRMRSTLVGSQVALAVVLVIGAGLTTRSFLELQRVDPGFSPEHVLTVSLGLNTAGVPGPELGEHIVLRRDEIIESVSALPGVGTVGMINRLPLRAEGEPMEFRRADRGEGGPPLRVDARFVNSGYFSAMGIPLVRGEPLPDQWAPGATVPVVINEAAARRAWPGEDAVGQIVLAPWGEAVVVGIVGDHRQTGLYHQPEPAAFMSQWMAPRTTATLVVRAAGDPAALAGSIRQAIHVIDPAQPIRDIATLRGVLSESIARDRFFAALFGAFGALALALAAVGIYGVLAYSVSQRTREIGVRMALGATAGAVLRLVLGAGMSPVLVGAAVGTGAALLLTRLLQTQLHGVSPTDPLAFAAALCFLALVALVACLAPARRATRVDPITALRAE